MAGDTTHLTNRWRIGDSESSSDSSSLVFNIKGQKSVTIKDESRIVKYSLDGTADKQIELSIDDALSLLIGIRDSYKQSNIKTAEYEKMVLNIIQNCIASIDDSDKINFVVNGILDSGFMSFLNDRMLKKLRGSIIESVSNKI